MRSRTSIESLCLSDKASASMVLTKLAESTGHETRAHSVEFVEQCGALGEMASRMLDDNFIRKYS